MEPKIDLKSYREFLINLLDNLPMTITEMYKSVGVSYITLRKFLSVEDCVINKKNIRKIGIKKSYYNRKL